MNRDDCWVPSWWSSGPRLIYISRREHRNVCFSLKQKKTSWANMPARSNCVVQSQLTEATELNWDYWIERSIRRKIFQRLWESLRLPPGVSAQVPPKITRNRCYAKSFKFIFVFLSPLDHNKGQLRENALLFLENQFRAKAKQSTLEWRSDGWEGGFADHMRVHCTIAPERKFHVLK